MTERFCWINGRRHTVGDVVLDLRGNRTPQVRVSYAEPVAWRWFVVRVNPNCDERAVRSLSSKGVKERVLTFPQGKRTERERSLFPRYLFAGLGTNWRGEVDCVTPTKCDGVEGESRSRNVVIEFPDYETALACYRSPEYQANIKLRQPHSIAELIVVEGYDGAQP